MNYIGSKYSLLDFLEEHIVRWVGTTSDLTFLDIFAGTGVVGHHFKRLGYRILANDIQYYSYCLNRALVVISKQPDFAGLVDDLPAPVNTVAFDNIDIVLHYLNSLEGQKGFIYYNYCPGGTANNCHVRQYFTDENGKHCDAISLQLREWLSSGKITNDEYFYLLASLIEAIDKVANTASVYGAFLKKIKSSARKPLKLERVKIVSDNRNHQAFNVDAACLVDQLSYDILYMDPPYNQRQYCTNYHVLETVARYDEPQLKGITGLREYSNQRSAFCSKHIALDALNNIIQHTPARFVFLSYNSEGIMKAESIISIMQQHGTVEIIKRPYRRFRADVDSEQRQYKSNGVEEYLFCLKKL